MPCCTAIGILSQWSAFSACRSPDPAPYRNSARWLSDHAVSGVCSLTASNVQLCRYRQFEELAPQKPRREKQDRQVLHLTDIRIETRDHLVAQLLRFLLRIRRAFIDIQNVCVGSYLKVSFAPTRLLFGKLPAV